jgi:glycosyltransferase involved in cell wall biosynthesis
VILYVLRYWPTLTETFAHDEIRAMAERFPVALAAFDPRGDPHADPPPAPVHTRPHRWGWLRALPSIAREWLRGPAPLRVLWLTTIVRRARRVHVHFAGEAAAWTRAACARAGVPYGVTVHAVDLFKPRADLGELLRDADLVVTISEHNRALIARRYGVDAELVRCGVDPGRFPTRAPANPPVVLGVGRWVPKKGLDVLAAVAPRLDGAVVRLLSDAPALPGVEVRGLVPRAAVAAELAGAAVFVLPCREAPDGDLDGIPVALLEAIAAGVPVVTTAVSGIPEIVDESVGWIVPPDDPEALLTAIRRVLAAPAEAARRATTARVRLAERGFLAQVSHEAMAELLARPARRVGDARRSGYGGGRTGTP